MVAKSGFLDILQRKMGFIREEYGRLQNGIISASEFAQKINPTVNELIFEQKWRDIIKNEQIKSLSHLLINLNTRVKTYDSLRELGDDEESNIQLNKLKDVAFQLIDKIASAIQYLHSKEEASELDVTIKENSKGTEIKSKDLFFKDEHKFFVGRKEYIDKIIFEAIIKPSSCVSIIGIGGSGKTQLAYQAMRKSRIRKIV